MTTDSSTLSEKLLCNAKSMTRLGTNHEKASPSSLPKSHSVAVVESFQGKGETLHVYFFEIANYFTFKNFYGNELAEQILTHFHEALEEMGRAFCLGKEPHIEALEQGQFILLCPPKDCEEEAESQVLHMRMQLKGHLREEALKRTGQGLDVLAGSAVVNALGTNSPEASLYNALCDAQRAARGDLSGIKPSMLHEFRNIIQGRLVHSVYQPIVDLSSGRIYAWEALVRGPADSFFETPTALFDFAEETSEVFHLETACREAAIKGFGSFAAGQKLFLNIHPRTLVDPSFTPGETRKLLEAHGLRPEDVVFEITERHAIRDFTTFHETLEHYRSQGYMIAVDDVGTGYSGLWSIAELRPDFLKIDMSFVRGIDTNPVKRALLETFVSFSEKIGCRIIAEGIETPTELSSIISMGTHFGQGYHLARPATPKPTSILKRTAWSAAKSANLVEAKCSIPIRELAGEAYAIPPETKVSEAKAILKGDEPISALVVVRNNRPLGLIMSHHLDRALSSRYGMSLYYHREVTRIMDSHPLIVEGETPVEAVARRASNRERNKIYDHIITANSGELHGIVSVQKMLDTLAAVQVNMAKGVNPLTGLPGNVAIEQEIENRSSQGQCFSLVYADLDNFKVYNDVYGFKNGDNVIMLMAKVLSWAVKRHGNSDDFCGHVGGDDFIAITSHEKVERVCKAIVRCFGRLIRYHYSEQDRERGRITGRDRSGVERDFDLVSVSLAIVDTMGCCCMADIARRSAEMKKYAKKLPGNAYVRDRRGPLEPGSDEEEEPAACR